MSRLVTRHQQRRLDWLQTSAEIEWNGPVNLARRAYLVDGHLDEAALTEAGRHVARRHSVLRSTYHRGPEGSWTAQVSDDFAVDTTIWPQATSGQPAEAADDIWKRQEPFGPMTSPRFRIHVIPMRTCTVLMLVADRLVTDDTSMATLTAHLADAYNALLAGEAPEPPVDERWWDHLSSTAPADDPGVPAYWQELAGHMATNGAHAEIDLPVARAFSEYPDTLETDTLTMPWPATGATESVSVPAQVAAVAEPVVARTGHPVWIYLYPDLRPPGHTGAAGPYTARTLVQVPPRGRRSQAEHLITVSHRYYEATGPGIAWTELVHDRAGSNHAPPRRPSIAVIQAGLPAVMRLDGTRTTALPTRTVDLGPGRIVYEVGQATLAIHHEADRYPSGLISALGHETSALAGDARQRTAGSAR